MAIRDVFVRTPYNYDVDEASEDSGLTCVEPSLTKQEFKEECDINTIIERFGLAYQMPEGTRMPTYGDFTGLDSYHEAMNAIAQAGESFDVLPASVRARFQNNPGQFVDFVLDEKNREEAVKLGLVPERSPGSSAPTSVVPTPGVRLDLPNEHPANKPASGAPAASS
ncbi:MAG: internal scaffolding protein [Microviridae sp.]|nr:MAG: internal scaffolding protein [Microviridae sp.]